MIELMERTLPKWTLMYVTGEKITEKQALEIIRRTDAFLEFPFGNDKPFVKEVLSILQMPDVFQTGELEECRHRFLTHEEWLKNWDYIHTEFVTNDWICSNFVGGAHGWCHPDGTIAYQLRIGKWPTVTAVMIDWVKIATAFPFLNLEATLINEEDDVTDEPIVSFLIRNGAVKLVDPNVRDIHNEQPREKLSDREFFYNFDKIVKGDYSISEKIPMDVIREWAKRL